LKPNSSVLNSTKPEPSGVIESSSKGKDCMLQHLVLKIASVETNDCHIRHSLEYLKFLRQILKHL
jgi:hypothetical protein